MIPSLQKLWTKNEKIGIGLMSGTSVDGVDVAVIKVSGNGLSTKYSLLAFDTIPFPEKLTERIFNQFNPQTSSVDVLCSINFELGTIFKDAAEKVVEASELRKEDIDFIGSHGQTFYHIPKEKEGLLRSTLQLGEASILAQHFQCPVVSDFRVRDIAAGGEGAPLVPYIDYLMFGQQEKNIALQNIGGIGNVTFLPKGLEKEHVIAFDTGPGNMVIDEAVKILTGGKLQFDNEGEIAKKGTPNKETVARLLENPYFSYNIPKSTGRERFGAQYTRELVSQLREQRLSIEDIIATVTMFTAASIVDQYKRFIPQGIDELIVSGGGAYNKTLLKYLSESFCVKTQEDIGFSSDAKEAIAFALLANETLSGNANNLPVATGANESVVLGKIII
ncbi:anhydro-N-acetylmuramic acid kinase AnmK [Sutcliffiella cohnii]|uniref:anhydro-N-acetylmuramic acid kinase AnmK n=1 Tax=Sutcliffiella cohnii TaxID=33932 RepID=UPI002E2281C8|nr:anhydro-N-acetylmuramic acid kinase AnmK [Sutcliffiella cohnii]MED4016133.1 anhydro-N-acetylmuramic acid kinase AnmK [Sutcliffiella cohnii]